MPDSNSFNLEEYERKYDLQEQAQAANDELTKQKVIHEILSNGTFALDAIGSEATLIPVFGEKGHELSAAFRVLLAEAIEGRPDSDKELGAWVRAAVYDYVFDCVEGE